MNKYVSMFEGWLRAAFIYYWMDDNIISDFEWDSMGRELKANWDEFEHPLKAHIETDAMNSLHYLPKETFVEIYRTVGQHPEYTLRPGIDFVPVKE